MSELAHEARRYHAAGLSVLPAHRDGEQKRVALHSWKPYQRRLPTEAELRGWFTGGRHALCLVCGAVSGNLEMIDFDAEAEAFDAWCELVRESAPGLFEQLVIEVTPSGGRHVAYRCEIPVCGNLKLAQRKLAALSDEPIALGGKTFVPRRDPDGNWSVLLTLIETRGEGGIFLCAPSDGYALSQGDFTGLPIIGAEQRETLLSAASQLNEVRPEPDPLPPSSSEDARPGDDYAQRGDVRALLVKHGWTLARRGDNELWRRPGKIAGTSATLKDGVFYVFSSNAAPFEPNRGYGPFALYAHLEHNGDFAAAARALREEGFGGEPACPDGVDISGIMGGARGGEPVEPPMADPGFIPDELLRIPGFVSEVMGFTLANAPYPNVGLAFCGAVALQSYLCGRKVCDSGDLRPNVYVLALASSGTGKDFPRKVNSRVLFEIGQIAALGDKFASGEGIQDALLRNGAMLFQNDEMDGVLRQINLDRENKRESIPNILLTLYTSAGDVYPIRAKAGQKETLHVDQPHLTLFGTATPQCFYESLSPRMLTNGFFARMIIIDVGGRGEGRTPGSPRHLPASIVQTANWWADFQPGTTRKNLLEVHPEPKIVPYSTEGEAAIACLQKLADAEYEQAHQRNDEVARTAWSRTCEHAKKLALIYACSENHQNPVITLAAIEWATAFAMHQTRRQLYLATTYVAENPFHADCLKLLRRLREAPDRQLAHSVLLKRMKTDAKSFTTLIETLCQQGEIEIVTTPRAGWPVRGYRLVAGESSAGGET